MPLVNLELTKGQNWSKSYRKNIFHVFTLNLRLSEICVKFDLRLTLDDNQNPNFDPTLKWVGIDAIAKNIEIIFQQLLMG